MYTGSMYQYSAVPPSATNCVIANSAAARAHNSEQGRLSVQALAQAKAAESDAFSDFSQAEQAQLKEYLRRLADKMSSGL